MISKYVLSRQIIVNNLITKDYCDILVVISFTKKHLLFI